MVKSFDEIFRDFEIAGVPSSGAHKPIKLDIREALSTVQAFSVPTRADAITFTVPSSYTYLRVSGYATVSDGGGGLYIKVSTPSPVKPWHFQSADGAWWQLVETSFVTPLQFGAPAVSGSDSSTAIANALAYATQFKVTLKFPGGGRIYEKAGRTVVSDNNYIWIENGATLRRTGSDPYIFVNGDGTRGGGYTGCLNVTIRIDGVVDCGRSGTSITTAFWVGAHQSGLHVFGDGEITNSYGSHIFEVNSSRNVIIENLRITDRLFPTTGNFETVQIDFSSSAGFPAFGPYDNTPCQNVVVRNLYIQGGQSGVGSHSTPPVTRHSAITVEGNYIDGVSGYGIRSQGWINSRVVGNTIYNSGNRGILSYDCENLIIEDNMIVGGCPTVSGNTGYGIAVGVNDGVTPVNVSIRGNMLIGVSAVGILLASGSNHEIANNYLLDSGEGAILVNSSLTRFSVHDNRVFGASAAVASAASAVRILGSSGKIYSNLIKRSSAANTYAYAIYFPTGSTLNTCDNNDVQSGTTGAIGDQVALSLNSFNGKTLLFTGGNVTSGTLTLAASVNGFFALELQTGAVGSGTFSSGRAVPFANKWNTETDHVTIKTISGKVDCTFSSNTVLTVVTANDGIRSIYGLAS